MVKFVNEIPTTSGRGRKRSPEVQTILDALATKPGVWAEAFKGDPKRGTSIAGAIRRTEGFTAQVRTQDDGSVIVYAQQVTE